MIDAIDSSWTVTSWSPSSNSSPSKTRTEVILMVTVWPFRWTARGDEQRHGARGLRSAVHRRAASRRLRVEGGEEQATEHGHVLVELGALQLASGGVLDRP